MTTTGTYYAVQLGPDKNPSNGSIIHEVPATGDGVPQSIMDLWKPAEIAIVWGYDRPIRQLSEESLASVRQKRLRRRLEEKVPLLADEFEQREHAAKPDFFAGKREAMEDEQGTFQKKVKQYRDRMVTLRETFNSQGYLLARSQRDPGYQVVLTRGTTAAFNVHSFRDGQPVGHRDYDRLEGGSPVQNALQEFASADFQLIERRAPGREP